MGKRKHVALGPYQGSSMRICDPCRKEKETGVPRGGMAPDAAGGTTSSHQQQSGAKGVGRKNKHRLLLVHRAVT